MKAIKYDNVLHYEYVSIRKGDLITFQGSLKIQTTVLISRLTDSKSIRVLEIKLQFLLSWLDLIASEFFLCPNVKTTLMDDQLKRTE